MVLPDVNILVYAYSASVPEHQRIRAWLEDVLNGDQAFGMADLVVSGFLRVVTHPRIFNPPAPLADALAFADAVRSPSQRVVITPGPRHWSIFQRLCVSARAKGSLVADAYLAAMAIESGCEFVTTDRDFARFPGLRWRHPLD